MPLSRDGQSGRSSVGGSLMSTVSVLRFCTFSTNGTRLFLSPSSEHCASRYCYCCIVHVIYVDVIFVRNVTYPDYAYLPMLMRLFLMPSTISTICAGSCTLLVALIKTHSEILCQIFLPFLCSQHYCL